MIHLRRGLLALAEQQLGVLARYQLVRWLRPEQIDGYVRRGRLTVVQRGVYRVAGGATLPQQAPFAAALRARPGATVTGPAVLAHLGVDGFPAGAPFEILVAPRRSLRNVDFPWRLDPRPDRPVTRCGDVRLAAAGDALVHSVRWRDVLGDRALRLGCDWLGWRGLIDRAVFLDRLVARSGVDPDAAELLEVLGGLELGRSESEGERRIGVLVLGFAPAPRPQVWVTPHRRSDWVFEELGVVIEYDGRLDHTGAANAAADAAREAELAASGYRLVRVTAADLEDEPELLARIAAALTLGAVERGLPTPTYDPTRCPSATA